MIEVKCIEMNANFEIFDRVSTYLAEYQSWARILTFVSGLLAFLLYYRYSSAILFCFCVCVCVTFVR